MRCTTKFRNSRLISYFESESKPKAALDFSVPARELINVVALAQAVLFAGVILCSRLRHSMDNRILGVLLLIFATIKIDQLYQVLGGLEAAPQYAFIFLPLQWLMTPALYFYVLSRVIKDFRFKQKDTLHLIPAIIVFVYFWAVYFRLPVEGKIAYLASGVLSQPLNRIIIPLLTDIIQLTYFFFAFKQLNNYGISLKNWFSKVDDYLIVWIRRILSLWAFVFLVHMIFPLSFLTVGPFAELRYVLDFLNILHLVLVNSLIFLAVYGYFKVPELPQSLLTIKKYAASNQSPKERAALFDRLEQHMKIQRPYLDAELNLGELAAQLEVSPRELSEAINGEGGSNFYDYVNGYRLDEVKTLLVEQKNESILAIAFAAGFNSKSVFNRAFKYQVGVTPSQYRANN